MSKSTEAEIAARLGEAAARALKEAQVRREAAENASPLPTEYQGQKGLEPTRYGDWEKKGIISDF